MKPRRRFPLLAALGLISAAFLPAADSTRPIETLAEQFRHPPAEFRLVQYGLNDQTLEKYPRYGIGGFMGFFHHNLYQSKSGGRERIGPLVEAAAKKNMRVWLADDFGYPSGMAGGRVIAENPAYEVRGLAMVSLEGAGLRPAVIELPAGAERFVSAVLYPLIDGIPDYPRGQVIPAGERRVESSGLAGPWHLSAFATVIRDHDVQAQSTTAQFQHTGHYPDLLNPDAVARFIANMHAPIVASIGDLSSRTIGFYANEPNLMQLHWQRTEAPFACVSWNDQLPGAFLKQHGYVLTPLLGALYAGEDTVARRVRMHFHQTVADLLAAGFARQIREWCHARGVLSSGHFLLEEHLALHVANYGDYMKFVSEFDVPAIDTGIPNADRVASFNYQFARFTSSVAVWKERDRTMCLLDPIISGGGRKRLSPAMPLLHNSVNMACLYGIGEFSAYLPLEARPDGTATGYTVEEYRDFNDYLGRLCLLLRGARSATSVALYYPIAQFQADYRPSRQFYNTSLSNYRRQHGAWDATETALREADIECTIVHPEAVAQSVVDQGTMTIGHGSYRYLVLPQLEFIPGPVLEKIRTFEAGGGAVLWVDTKPQAGAYAPDDAAVAAALKAAKIVRTAELAAHITQPYAAPFDLRFAPGPERLAIARFQRGNQKIHLLVNRTAEPIQAAVRSVGGARVEVFDPTTGSITPISLPAVLELGGFRSMLLVR